MGIKIRKITDDMCEGFTLDMHWILFDLDRTLDRNRDFERSEWLGGDSDHINSEEAPEECRGAMEKLRAARKLISEADSQIAIFRVLGASREDQ